MNHLQDQMLKVLSDAQKQRKARPGMIEIVNAWGHRETIPAWALYEISTMLKEVNLLRMANHLESVTLTEIQKVESMARGHSDYSSKFALYCAEMTVQAVERIQA